MDGLGRPGKNQDNNTMIAILRLSLIHSDIPLYIPPNAADLARSDGQRETLRILCAMASTNHVVTVLDLLNLQGLTDPRSAMVRLRHLERNKAIVRYQWAECPECHNSGGICEYCDGTGAIAVPSVLHLTRVAT